MRRSAVERSSNSGSKNFALSDFLNSGEKLKLGRKHRPDYLIAVLMIVLALIGLITLFSIAPAITMSSDTSLFMWRQGIFLIAGLITFFIVSRVPLDFWRRRGTIIFVLALILCFILPIMGWIGIPPAHCNLGACRWFRFGAIGTFQPAEFLKLGIVLFTSGFLAARITMNKINDWRKTLIPVFAVLFVALFVIVVMQRDLGTGVALVAIVLTQAIIAGVKVQKLVVILGLIAGLGVVSIAIAPHRLARIATFIGQGDEVANYHINQAMIALGSGGFSGRGLGQSVQAFGWLPEAIHDSIFAIIGEMFGFVGLLGILILFAILLKRIIEKVDFLESPYLRLVVAGIFGWIMAHVVLNVGAMTRVIPLTGITLPLVSLGGTSLLFVMASLGIVFAISRYTVHRKIDIQKGVEEDADPMRRRRVGRSHYANRRGR